MGEAQISIFYGVNQLAKLLKATGKMVEKNQRIVPGSGHGIVEAAGDESRPRRRELIAVVGPVVRVGDGRREGLQRVE